MFQPSESYKLISGGKNASHQSSNGSIFFLLMALEPMTSPSTQNIQRRRCQLSWNSLASHQMDHQWKRKNKKSHISHLIKFLVNHNLSTYSRGLLVEKYEKNKKNWKIIVTWLSQQTNDQMLMIWFQHMPTTVGCQHAESADPPIFYHCSMCHCVLNSNKRESRRKAKAHFQKSERIRVEITKQI